MGKVLSLDALKALADDTLDQTTLAAPGAMLFCGPTAIKPGPVYVMGLNPGGDPTKLTGSVGEHLAVADGTSPYTHECWQPACRAPAPCEHMDGAMVRAEWRVRHQRNMIALTGALGREPVMLPSANAIFARSTSLSKLKAETDCDAWGWWKRCWPMHQQLLAIVRPRLIVTLGFGERTSPLGLLMRQTQTTGIERIGDADRSGGWTFTCTLDLGADRLGTRVIGVPHPSYRAPGPELVEELARASRA